MVRAYRDMDEMRGRDAGRNPATRNSALWLWLAAAVSLGLSLAPWGDLVLYPFKLFTTWVHEGSHALVTLAVGGAVSSIVIDPNTSGRTLSLVPNALLAKGLVTSAGYLGASTVGCLLMAATRLGRWAHRILYAMGGAMLASLVVWMRNPFGIAVVLSWGVALLLLARFGNGSVARFVLSLLAIQVALDAVYDIRVLFLVHGAHSDADAMAQLFLIPSWVWASAWMTISVAMLGWTLWVTRVRAR